MTSHATISSQEAADRLAIRELIDAYAHCADRRDAKGQMALFTADTRFIVFMDATAAEPTQQLHGRESLAPDGQRTLMIASIRYLDELVKQDGRWLFAERRLMVDWTETRPSPA